MNGIFTCSLAAEVLLMNEYQWDGIFSLMTVIFMNGYRRALFEQIVQDI